MECCRAQCTPRVAAEIFLLLVGISLSGGVSMLEGSAGDVSAMRGVIVTFSG